MTAATNTVMNDKTEEVQTQEDQLQSLSAEPKTDADSDQSSNKENNSSSENKQSERERRRLRNMEFFSRDLLGPSQRDCLTKEITLRSVTGRKLYNLVYERMDAYLHRPKEYANVVIARDKLEQVQKRIDTRLTELENYVNKRHKQLSRLFELETQDEEFEYQSENQLTVKAPFSNNYSRKFLNIIEKIDEACYMAAYLEMVGAISMKQESDVTSQLYRKTIEISKILMKFIASAIISIRRDLRSRKN